MLPSPLPPRSGFCPFSFEKTLALCVVPYGVFAPQAIPRTVFQFYSVLPDDEEEVNEVEESVPSTSTTTPPHAVESEDGLSNLLTPSLQYENFESPLFHTRMIQLDPSAVYGLSYFWDAIEPSSPTAQSSYSYSPSSQQLVFALGQKQGSVSLSLLRVWRKDVVEEGPDGELMQQAGLETRLEFTRDRASLNVHKELMLSVGSVHGGRVIVTGGRRDSTVCFWDVQESGLGPRVVHRLPPSEVPFSTLRIKTLGNWDNSVWLAGGTPEDAAIQVVRGKACGVLMECDVEMQRVLWRDEMWHEKPIYGLVADLNSNVILTTSSDVTVKCASRRTREKCWSMNVSPVPQCMFYDEARTEVYIGTKSGKILVFDLRNPSEKFIRDFCPSHGETDFICSIQKLDDSRCASVALPGTFSIWRASTGKVLQRKRLIGSPYSLSVIANDFADFSTLAMASFERFQFVKDCLPPSCVIATCALSYSCWMSFVIFT